MADSDDLGRRTIELLAEQLPGVDLGDASDDDLIVAAARIAQYRETLPIIIGRLIAELNRRGMSYGKISALIDVPRPTVYRWAAPFKTQETP